jgi:serine/threonine protein kinase
MLIAADIMAGKMLVQLGLAPAEVVRAQLRRIRDEPHVQRDLINRFTDAGVLPQRALETLRHRVGLYEHVRGEAAYIRLLEKHANVPKPEVYKLIANLERSAFRRRLGDVLVRMGTITKKQDDYLVAKQREQMLRDDAKVLERYLGEDFAGVSKPIIPGSRLEPDDFKISTLFRSKETQRLVHQVDLLGALASTPSPDASPPQAPGSGQYALPPRSSPPGGAPQQPSTNPARPRTGRVNVDVLKDVKQIADYGVVEVLGVGGMGAVFLAQKAGRGVYVAVKVLLNQAASKEEHGRFGREIKLSQRVHHPSVITVIDHGETQDGMTYLVVPALAGKELRDHLEKAGGKGLPAAIACEYMEKILDGMQAVHDARIVHRDLKPENVFVLAGGKREIRIMDFGLAKLDNEAFENEGELFRTMEGEIVGSPAYIAPESIMNDPIDGRTDIYSLGVMFFELLTGVKPIESETMQGYLTQHVVCPPLKLAEARPEKPWPEEMESLLDRMLGKTRDARPASARAVIDELRTIKPKLLAAHSQAEEAAAAAAAKAAATPVPPTAEMMPPAGLPPLNLSQSNDGGDPEKTPKISVKGLLGRLWNRK